MMRKISGLLCYCGFLWALAFVPSMAICQDLDEAAMQGMTAVKEHAQALKAPAATVNGAPISIGDVMQRMESIANQHYGSGEITPTLSKRIKAEALQGLVDEKLAIQKAESLGIAVDAGIVDAELKKLRQRFDSDEKFREYLTNTNKTENELRSQIEQFLIVQQAIKQEVDSQVSVSPEDIKKGYESNKEMFTQKEKVTITDVIFFLDPDAPETKSTVEKVFAMVENELGRDPKKLTTDGTFIVREEVEISRKNYPAIRETAVQMQIGALSPIINVDGTLHFFRLTEYIPEVTKPLAEVAPYLEKKLLEKFKNEKLAKWRLAIREDAKIEYLDILDSFELRTK